MNRFGGGGSVDRRALLAGFGAALLAVPAAAQTTPRPRRGVKPRPAEPTKLPSAPPPPRDQDLATTGPAPVPNRNLEAPRRAIEDRPRLDPSLIQRNLPGRGMATDGSVSTLEERMFKQPVPGARLSLPFSY